MASHKEYKMTIPNIIHARQAKLGEPLCIDVGGSKIIMYLNKPGFEHVINVPASCGLEAIFEALGNHRLHVPPQGRAMKVTMPGVPFNHIDLDSEDNFDKWEMETAPSDAPICWICSSPQTGATGAAY